MCDIDVLIPTASLIYIYLNLYFFLIEEVFTDRIRRMGEGNVFSLFKPEGYASQVQTGGVPRPGLDMGEGTPR